MSKVSKKRMSKIITNHIRRNYVGLKQNIYIMKSEKDIQVGGGIRKFHPRLTSNWNEDKNRYIKEVHENRKD